MSDFKFSCPQCDQHIQCDDQYRGFPLKCPTCQTDIVIPQPSAVEAEIRLAPKPPLLLPPDSRKVGTEANPLNPWLSMWTQPRAAMRHILNTNPKPGVAAMAAIFGLTLMLDGARTDPPDERMALWEMLMMGLIIGFGWVYLGGWILRWTGSWFGGQATTAQVRSALAWPAVIPVWLLALWIPQLAFSGNATVGTYFNFNAAGRIIEIWFFFAFVKCLAEAHRFSAWKAFAAWLPLCVLLIPLELLALTQNPNFLKAREEAQRRFCVSKLEEIHADKERWAVEKQKRPGTSTTDVEHEISPWAASGSRLCPRGGTYRFNPIGTLPTCSLGDAAGHRLESVSWQAGIGGN